MDEDKVFHSTHAPVLHESLLTKSLWSVLEVSAKIHVVISGLSLRILVGHSALPSVVPVPKSKLLGMQQQIFSPFFLINPLKKTLKALVQNFCLAYSDTGLRFSLCCLNSSCPWHAPQPVRRSLLTEPIFLCRYQMDLW